MSPRDASPQVGAMVATIQIPVGAVVVAPPPALFGSVCAAYLGMAPAHARRALAAMAEDPAFRGSVVVLSRRPRELAAPPDEVLRFLRARRSVATSEAAPETNDTAEQGDGADGVLAELGLKARPRTAGGAR